MRRVVMQSRAPRSRLQRIGPPGNPGGPVRRKIKLDDRAQPHRMAMAPAIERGRVRTAWPSLPELDHPDPGFLTDDLADMVRPNNDCTDACRSGLSPMGPIAREIECGTGIAGYEPPHLPTAPRRRTSAVAAARRAVLRIRIDARRGKPEICGRRVRSRLRREWAAWRPFRLRPRRAAAPCSVMVTVPVMVFARLCGLRTHHNGRNGDRKGRLLHAMTPNLFTRRFVVVTARKQKPHQTAGLARLSGRVCLIGSSRHRRVHSIIARCGSARFCMASICLVDARAKFSPRCPSANEAIVWSLFVVYCLRADVAATIAIRDANRKRPLGCPPADMARHGAAA